MNSEEHQKRKEEYEAKYKEHRKNGELGLCKDIMMEARRKFPRDFHIMMNLAETMDLYESGTKLQREEFISEKFSGQIYSLCQYVLEESKEEEERCRAVRLLCEHYVKAGNNSEALHLIKGIADMEHCREVLLEKVLSGEEKIRYVETANQLYYLLMPDGNFQFYHRIVGWNYRRLAELYLLKEDTDKAFEYLLLAEKQAMKYDELQDYKYTSLFVNSLEYKPEEYYKCWSGSERAMLLYRIREMQEYFEQHEGVKELSERLSRATEKEKAVNIE